MKKKKSKKKIILIICIAIIIILLSTLSYHFVNIKKINKNSRNMEPIVDEVKSNQINYVFLDINPSFTLVVQNDIISQVICRNDDCTKLKDSLNIEGKNLINAVDEIYNTATEKGYDTKNGVHIKTTSPLTQKLSTDYIYIETIEKDEEANLLNENIDTITIELSDNEKLIEKLKKDEDYGNIYSCSIINNEVECHLLHDMKWNGETALLQYKRIASVLNRFGIKTESAWEMGVVEEPLFKLYIDGSKFVNLGGNGIHNMAYIGTYNCGSVRFNLEDINLLNPIDIQEHFYYGEHDITYDKNDFEEHYGSGVISCGDIWCKASKEKHRAFCNIETNEITTKFEKMIYYIFKNENGERWPEDKSKLTEISYNEYLDFDYREGVFVSNIEKCKTNDEGYIINETDKKYCNNFGELYYFEN